MMLIFILAKVQKKLCIRVTFFVNLDKSLLLLAYFFNYSFLFKKFVVILQLNLCVKHLYNDCIS